jgi:hypothetical protein
MQAHSNSTLAAMPTRTPTMLWPARASPARPGPARPGRRLPLALAHTNSPPAAKPMKVLA